MRTDGRTGFTLDRTDLHSTFGRSRRVCDVDAVDKSQDVRVPKTRSTRVDFVNQNVDFSASISSMVVNWFNTCHQTKL